MRPVVGLLPVFYSQPGVRTDSHHFYLTTRATPRGVRGWQVTEAITGLPRKTDCSRVLGLCPGGVQERNYLLPLPARGDYLPNAGVL